MRDTTKNRETTKPNPKTAKIELRDADFLTRFPCSQKSINASANKIFEVAEEEYENGCRRSFALLKLEQRKAVILFARDNALPPIIYCSRELEQWLRYGGGAHLQWNDDQIARLCAPFSVPGEIEGVVPFTSLAILGFFAWASGFWQQEKESLEEYANDFTKLLPTGAIYKD